MRSLVHQGSSSGPRRPAFLSGGSHRDTLSLAHTKIPDSQRKARAQQYKPHLLYKQLKSSEPLLSIREQRGPSGSPAQGQSRKQFQTCSLLFLHKGSVYLLMLWFASVCMCLFSLYIHTHVSYIHASCVYIHTHTYVRM